MKSLKPDKLNYRAGFPADLENMENSQFYKLDLETWNISLEFVIF